jgi:hypothetical protein
VKNIAGSLSSETKKGRARAISNPALTIIKAINS